MKVAVLADLSRTPSSKESLYDRRHPGRRRRPPEHHWAIANVASKPVVRRRTGHTCGREPSLNFEQSSQGYLIVSPPSATFSNYDEVELLNQIVIWNKRVDFGAVGGLTGGPELLKGGRYAPDACQRRAKADPVSSH
jgi:hypothetical protein